MLRGEHEHVRHRQIAMSPASSRRPPPLRVLLLAVLVLVEGHLDDESSMRGRERDGEVGTVADVGDGMVLS